MKEPTATEEGTIEGDKSVAVAFTNEKNTEPDEPTPDEPGEEGEDEPAPQQEPETTSSKTQPQATPDTGDPLAALLAWLC